MTLATITIQSEGGRPIRAILGAARPTLSGGAGGWDEVQLPKRGAVSVWRGRPAYTLTIEVMLDRFRSGGNIEGDIDKLEAMSVAQPGSRANEPFTPPPPIRVEGAIPKAELRWIIDSIEWGAAEWSEAGHRTRQLVTLTLMEYREGSRFGIKPKGGKPRTRGYRVKRTDTLAKIARKELGSPRRWKDIRDARGNEALKRKNRLRDPNAKLYRRVRKLRIPLW